MQSRASHVLTKCGWNRAQRLELGWCLLPLLALVSLNVAGEPRPASVPARVSSTAAGNSYAPVFSVDGRHVAFISHANNLVTNDDLGPHLDLFVRDLVLSNTVLVSVSTNGFGGANNGTGLVTLSSNAQFVAFDTAASNLAPGDTNRISDIYVRDVTAGTTTLVSVVADGTGSGNGSSFNPLISTDGRYVIFESLASNLVTNDFNGTDDIFIRDLAAGITSLVSVNATNLVSSVTNRSLQIYGVELPNGPLRFISANLNGNPGSDLGDVIPAISSDGSLVAWDSPDDNLVADDLNRAWDVFVRNLDTGETQLVSMAHPSLPAATGIALSRLDLNPGAISANGQRIAILSLDNTIVPNDTNNWRDLFIRDLVTGSNINASTSTGRVPFSSQTNFPGTNNAVAPSLSADGRYLAFAGETSLGGQQTNRIIYWRDLQSSSNVVVTSGYSVSSPVLSADGRFVAFHSSDRLEPGVDGNNTSDIYIFVANFAPAYPVLRNPFAASVVNAHTSTVNGVSINPVFSPDSTWVVFQSMASDLTPDPDTTPGRYQLFARQFLTDQTNFAGGLARLISYTSAASSDLDGRSVELPLVGGAANPRFSTDSRFVAFESGTNLIYRHDLLGGFVTVVTERGGAFYTNFARTTNDLVCFDCGNPSLNADGRFAAYETRRGTNTSNDLFVKDLQTDREELISVNLAGNGGGNGSSFTPLISHDTRHVVFASRASDLVANDTNHATDIFVRDRFADVTYCLSQNQSGTGSGNRVSSNPVLAADGRTVAFQSFASDLVPGDYNDTRDVFVVTLGGPDNDGDGMEDDWEMAYFNTLMRDGSGDFDNDRASDAAEFRAGTSPANNTSVLQVLTLTILCVTPTESAQHNVLVWATTPGRTYRVEHKPDVDAPWSTVSPDISSGATTASYAHLVSDSQDRGFYRVVLVE